MSPSADDGAAAFYEQFGLDQPQVTESNDGLTVRVEGQLTCPAAVEWDMWFGDYRVGGERPRGVGGRRRLSLVMVAVSHLDSGRKTFIAVCRTGLTLQF